MSAGSESGGARPQHLAPPRQNGGWSAILVTTAAGATLQVSGHYMLFRPPDVGVELRRCPTQGGCDELILDRVLSQESPDPSSAVSVGSAMPRMAQVPVSYEERVTGDVSVVTIAPDGVRIPVQKNEPEG